MDSPNHNNQTKPKTHWRKWMAYPLTMLLEVAVTAGLLALHPYFPLGRYPIVYVITIMAVAYWLGEGPAVLAFVTGLVLFDTRFVPPVGPIWPLAESPDGWARFAAFFLGTSVVAFAMTIIHRSQRRNQLLAGSLRESNEHVTSILESITDAFFTLDHDWRITYVNSEALPLLRKSREELMGGDLWELFPEAAGTEFYKQYHKAISERTAVDFEVWYEPFGLWFEVRAYGSERGLSVYFHDITDRKQAQEARQQLASIVEGTNDAVISKALDGTILTWNAGAESLYGYIAEEAVGRSISMLMPPDASNEHLSLLERVAHGERIQQHEASRIRKDGTTIQVSLSISPMKNAAGQVVAASTIARDITEVVELRRAQERQVAMLQKALVPPPPSIDSGYLAAAVYLPALPGQSIGGDLYEVFRTEAGRIGILIGDVCGKGIEVAALAAAARSTVHSFAYELSSPGTALSHANAVLHSQRTEAERFVTVFLAIVDPVTGELTYARAGHPPAAIYRADGEIASLQHGNPPIGVWAEYEYETFKDRLDPGNKIILFTDGITDARRGKQLLGIDGIERALARHGQDAPEEVAAALLAAAYEWANGRLQDDVAILVVERVAGPSA